MKNQNVKIEFYHEKYKCQLDNFELEKSQEGFTSYPRDVFQTLEDSNRHFMVITDDTKLIGYFVLHEKNGPIEVGSHEKALLIRSLAIHKNEQRKGYGFLTMSLLPDFVRNHFDKVTDLVLLVEHANTPAQQLYKKIGFEDTGIRMEGRSGIQFLYQYIL